MEGNYTRVDTIEWDFGKMPISNKSALVMPIMLHVEDKVYIISIGSVANLNFKKYDLLLFFVKFVNTLFIDI